MQPLPPPPGPLPPPPPLPAETGNIHRGRGRPKGAKNLPKRDDDPAMPLRGSPKDKRGWTVMEQVFVREAEKVAEATILAATVGGDARSQGLILARLYPPRDARVTLRDPPPLKQLADVPGFNQWLLAQVVQGHLAPSEASHIAAICSRYVESVAALDHEARINTLEDRDAESQKYGRRL
jgi:hypothetical protein